LERLMMRLYGYVLGPTDYWCGGTLLRDYISVRLARPDDWMHPHDDLRRIKKMLAAAARLARDQGAWEGDFSAGPFIAGLPSGDLHTHVVRFWKQSNNGLTYAFSTVALPWLLSETMHRIGAAS
jgi:hypothetical protein